MSTEKSINFKYFSCKEGIYLSYEAKNCYSRYKINEQGSSIRFNKGKVVGEPTHLSGWLFYKGVKSIDSVEHRGNDQQINFRWELKPGKTIPKQLTLPKVLTCEEVGEWYDDDDYTYYWDEKYEFSSFINFYQRVSDTIKGEWEKVDFTVKHLGEIDFEDARSPMKSYSVCKSNWSNTTDMKLDLTSIAHYSDLDKMLTNPLLLHNRPCRLTVKQSYDIIRGYIKDNIDPKYAIVSSDYDFHLVVDKKYSVEPYTTQWEEKKANGKSYARPRIRQKTTTFHTEKMYDVGHDGHYGKKVEAFYGESLKDLIENIQLFLDELMFYINEPMKECPHCKGKGYINVSSQPKAKTEPKK